MAHYAVLDAFNTVLSVFVGKDETDPTEPDWEVYYARPGQSVKRTSYHTHAGQHSQGGVPFRKNFAGIGMIYDANRDAFIDPQPYPSWSLDENTCIWAAPIPMPTDDGYFYEWDEEGQTWTAHEILEQL
jgi:hypothetical protein